MRVAKEQENIRNKIYEPVDNEIHFHPENIPELEEQLLEHVDEQYSVCWIDSLTSDPEGPRDM